MMQNLSAIAFSRGPGSFSGIRINAAVTQALAWTHHLPVIPVSTLAATAQRAYQTLGASSVLVTLDARMNELYVAQCVLNGGVMQVQGEERLTSYEVDLPSFQTHTAAMQPLIVVGNGCPLLQTNHATERYPSVAATAEDVAAIGWMLLQAGKTVTANQALPVYLRDNAWKKLEVQRAEQLAKSAASTK